MQPAPTFLTLPYDILRMIALHLHPHQIRSLRYLSASIRLTFDDVAFAKDNLDRFLPSLSSSVRRGRSHNPSPASSSIAAAVTTDPTHLASLITAFQWHHLGPSYISALFLKIPISISLLHIVTPNLASLAAVSLDTAARSTHPWRPFSDPEPLLLAVVAAARMGAFENRRFDWEAARRLERALGVNAAGSLGSLDRLAQLFGGMLQGKGRVEPPDVALMGLLVALGALSALDAVEALEEVVKAAPHYLDVRAGMWCWVLVERCLVAAAMHGSLLTFGFWLRAHLEMRRNALDESLGLGSLNLAFEAAAEHGQMEVVSFLIDVLEGKCASPLFTSQDLTQASRLIDPSTSNNRPLRLASTNGHIDIVRLLLLNGGKQIDPSADSNDALTWAADGGYEEIVDILLNTGKCGVYPNPALHEALQRAALWGHKGCVRRLLTFEIMRMRAVLDGIAFHLFGKQDAGELEKRVLELGGDAWIWNALTPFITTPVSSETCVHGFHLSLPFTRSTPTHLHPDPFSQALVVAAGEGHVEIVGYTIRMGCLVGGWVRRWAGACDSCDDYRAPHFSDAAMYNSVALRKAAANGHAEVVAMLLNVTPPPLDGTVRWTGVPDPSACGDFALKRASENGHVRCVKLLLGTGRCDPGGEQSAAFRAACRIGHVEMVRLFLDFGGVDVAARGNLAIQEACANGHFDVVQILLTLPTCDPSANDAYALRMAAANGHTEIVKLLLSLTWTETGPPPPDPASCDNFALRKAAELGHVDVVQALLGYGRERKLCVERVRKGVVLGMVDPFACGGYAGERARRNGHGEVVRLIGEWGVPDR
ncbi:hypothetical protein HDU67_008720 [Dinochytrium kinnereticum]|nr:hypothetical protein HDU67_008720 [Dinochytrium kinnereticum]